MSAKNYTMKNELKNKLRGNFTGITSPGGLLYKPIQPVLLTLVTYSSIPPSGQNLPEYAYKYAGNRCPEASVVSMRSSSVHRSTIRAAPPL